MSSNSKPTLLVSGASGHLGRIVVEQLLMEGAAHVVAGTRDPAKVADLSARRAEVRVIDLDKPETLAAGFAGVDRMLLISTDGIGRRIAQHRAAIEAAEKAGVRHVVYTSGPAARPFGESPVPDEHYWTEQALAASPMGWTALRNHLYTDFVPMFIGNALKSGQIFSATGNGGRNYVTREDCARTAAAALASDFDGKRILDVTGPAPLTHDQLAALIGELTGKAITHIPLSADDLKKGMVAAGVPDAYATILAGFDVDASAGYHAVNTPVVKDLTGREPTSVRDYLNANRSVLAAAA